jgi:rhamnogalacturonan endolyase
VKERSEWPYTWMEHPDYPLKRGSVSGTLMAGGRPAANALMVLTAPAPDWQVQILNYIFSVRADSKGRFTIPAVRPGEYTLFAEIPGFTEFYRKDRVKVTAGGVTTLGELEYLPPNLTRLWEIGDADMRTTGFRLADQPRQYGLAAKVPADLTYEIGKSRPEQDWYYCQSAPGGWQVKFNIARPYTGDATLTIAIAGQTSDPRLDVLLNGSSIGTVTAGNSSAAYRSAVLGSSFYETRTIRFPASMLTSGVNTITLRLLKGSLMYDTIRLEVGP